MHISKLTFKDFPRLSLIGPLGKIQHDILRLEINVDDVVRLHGNKGSDNLLDDVMSLIVIEYNSMSFLVDKVL